MIADVNVAQPVTALHQIEISSRCNLACTYCIHRILRRPKVDMSRELYLAALEMVAYFVRQGTQHELNLACTGESTLHPDFVEYVGLAKSVLPNLVFATNGALADEGMIRRLARHKPRVWVTLHEPRRAMNAIQLYRKYGLLEGVSGDPYINPNDWGGQVAWLNPKSYEIKCPWMMFGRTAVTSMGKILACCLDSGTDSAIGQIGDDPAKLTTRPWTLCATCYQTIEVRS